MLTEIQRHKLMYAAKTSIAVLLNDDLWHILGYSGDERNITLTMARKYIPRCSFDVSTQVEDFDLDTLINDHDNVTFFDTVAVWDKRKMESNKG